MTLPDRLISEDRRDAQRDDDLEFLSEDGSPIECSLLQLSNAPTRGVLLDLSATGAKIRSRNAAGRVEPEQRMYLKARLAKPVGQLNEAVTVVRIDGDESSDLTTIGVRFVTPLATLKDRATRRGRRRR